MKNRTPLVVGVLLTALSLTACGGSPTTPTTTSPASEPSTETPRATVTTAPVTQSPTPAAEEPLTCENLISADTVDGLTAQGWTYREQKFEIKEAQMTLDGGLRCDWADYTTASDHGQMYGWGPITEQSARAAESALERDGWLRSNEDGSTYLTEDPAYALAKDEGGFGMTYEFGDGWVKFADTKQGLLLIERDE